MCEDDIEATEEPADYRELILTKISACVARLTAADKTIDAMRQQWYSNDFHGRAQETIRAYDAAHRQGRDG